VTRRVPGGLCPTQRRCVGWIPQGVEWQHTRFTRSRGRASFAGRRTIERRMSSMIRASRGAPPAPLASAACVRACLPIRPVPLPPSATTSSPRQKQSVHVRSGRSWHSEQLNALDIFFYSTTKRLCSWCGRPEVVASQHRRSIIRCGVAPAAKRISNPGDRTL
jgi:hypothetical protein